MTTPSRPNTLANRPSSRAMSSIVGGLVLTFAFAATGMGPPTPAQSATKTPADRVAVSGQPSTGLQPQAAINTGNGTAAGSTATTNKMVSATGSAVTAVQRPVGPNGNAGSKRAILVNQRAPIVRASNQVGLAAAPKIVVGADDRRIVSNTTSRWARQTVLIYEATTGGWCTGFMVSPDTVATAGHCVYHNSPGKPVGWWDYRNTTVYPGYNGSTGVAPYGSCSVKDMYTNTSWQATQNNWNYDYAAIKLNCTVGNTVGWYGMTTNGYTTATTLYTQGYPQDKTPKYSMWSTSGTVAQFLSFGQLVTYMDIIGGQSGSPVYRYDSGCQYCAVAIVSWSGASYNGLNRLNTNSVNMIKGVINS